MNIKSILVLLLITQLICCSDDECSDIPTLNQSHSIDINNDGNVDYSFTYREIAVPQTLRQYSSVITPSNSSNLINDSTFLARFFTVGDTIFLNNPTQYSWAQSGYQLMRIQEINQIECVWEDSWEIINGPQNENFYYLGVNFDINDKDYIGYVKLILDQNNGEIILSDSDYTEDDFLVVQ